MAFSGQRLETLIVLIVGDVPQRILLPQMPVVFLIRDSNEGTLMKS